MLPDWPIVHILLVFVFELPVLSLHSVDLAAKISDINLVLPMPHHEEIFDASLGALHAWACQGGATAGDQLPHLI